ncbi:hypothetical protein E4U54_001948 [Claviceps lovelessii]|nr:hypothetical protein E4U54_001948 [Claviceps lovelessii]
MAAGQPPISPSSSSTERLGALTCWLGLHALRHRRIATNTIIRQPVWSLTPSLIPPQPSANPSKPVEATDAMPSTLLPYETAASGFQRCSPSFSSIEPQREGHTF